MRIVLCFVVALAGALGLPGGAWAQPRTYLALGDSYGFGYLTGALPEEYGPGDWGYVAPYADWLATRPGFGGVRPTVVNVSVPGETVGSFYDTSNLGRIYNSNYNFFQGPSQIGMLTQKVQQEQGAGRVISTVSVSMGGNDLLALRGQSGFAALSLAQQRAAVDTALIGMQTGYERLLSSVRTLLPGAELLVIGYFNPFPGAPDSVFAPVSQYAIDQINTRIAAVAAGAGGRFVDIAPRFVGREAEWSYIGAAPAGNNIHPNALGYAQIAQAMIPAPGAGSVIVIGWMVAGRRRRAA